MSIAGAVKHTFVHRSTGNKLTVRVLVSLSTERASEKTLRGLQSGVAHHESSWLQDTTSEWVTQVQITMTLKRMVENKVQENHVHFVASTTTKRGSQGAKIKRIPLSYGFRTVPLELSTEWWKKRFGAGRITATHSGVVSRNKWTSSPGDRYGEIDASQYKRICAAMFDVVPEKEVAVLKQRVIKLEKEIAYIQTEILEKPLLDLKKKLVELKKIGFSPKLKTDIVTLENHLEQRKQIDELKGNIVALNAEISSTERFITVYQTFLEKPLLELERKLVELKKISFSPKLKTDIDTLENVLEQRKRIAELKSKIVTLNAEISSTERFMDVVDTLACTREDRASRPATMKKTLLVLELGTVCARGMTRSASCATDVSKQLECGYSTAELRKAVGFPPLRRDKPQVMEVWTYDATPQMSSLPDLYGNVRFFPEEDDSVL